MRDHNFRDGSDERLFRGRRHAAAPARTLGRAPATETLPAQGTLTVRSSIPNDALTLHLPASARSRRRPGRPPVCLVEHAVLNDASAERS
jgi:hypothetical protein